VTDSRRQWTNRQVAVLLMALAAALYLTSVAIIVVRN
jgi:hypothetical protein